jgi:hypothetical protein
MSGMYKQNASFGPRISLYPDAFCAQGKMYRNVLASLEKL